MQEFLAKRTRRVGARGNQPKIPKGRRLGRRGGRYEARLFAIGRTIYKGNGDGKKGDDLLERSVARFPPPSDVSADHLFKGAKLDVDANLSLVAGEKREDFSELGAEEEEGKNTKIGAILGGIGATGRKWCFHDHPIRQIGIGNRAK